MSDFRMETCRQAMLARIELTEAVESNRIHEPTRFYRSHAEGQRQFHQAPHIIRALWPGNGFGKTRAMGTEAAWWATHRHPWQVTPKWPVVIIWACETYKQFEILRAQLDSECFGPERGPATPGGWKFEKKNNCYVWPDGSKMFLISGDGSWTHIQGINPDLCCLDEEPPGKLWSELRMRRRGRRKTRFCFAATATQGLTWMYRDLYVPWLKHHQAAGMTVDQAVEAQTHPLTWAWPMGGIASNPGADAGDRAYYAAQTFASEAERSVRLFGGFADFSGQPVFDLAAMESMWSELTDGETGTLSPVLKDDGKTPVAGKYQFVADGPDAFGRVTIFEHPPADRRARYVIGHDSAYGLAEGDFDYAVVLDRATGRQVAEAQGRWGDVGWVNVLAGLYWYFLGAFMVGERQVGLPVMRRLYDEMGIGYQYYNRDDASRARRKSDALGHFRRAGDLTIRNLRKAIGGRDGSGRLLPPEIIIRSAELHRQLTKYQFAPRRSTLAIEDAHDDDLRTGAPEGDHDDGVLAAGYAYMGLREVDKFPEAEPKFEEGTYGKVLGHDKVFGAKKAKTDPFGRD